MLIRIVTIPLLFTSDLVPSCKEAACLRLWLCNRQTKLCRCSTKSGEIICTLKDLTEESDITVRQGMCKGQVTIEPSQRVDIHKDSDKN